MSIETHFTMKTVEIDSEKAAEAQELVQKMFLSGETNSRTMAQLLKFKFDEKYGPSWHCVVGNSFGTMLSHEKDNFIYFYANDKAVLLFKSL